MAIDFTKAVVRKQTAIVQVDPFDLDTVKEKFAPYREALEQMQKQAESHEVKDDETLTQATTMAGEAKRLAKKADNLRKDLIADHNEFVKKVNGFTKQFTDPLGAIEAGLKRKIGNYQYQQELQRREDERKAREEAEALQKKLDAEAKEKNVEPVHIQAPVMPTAPKVSRGEDGSSASIRKVWTFEIQDPAAVPREYCVPDPKLIREAVKAGIREISGVRVFEDVQTVLRT
jgi:hypothetical protein